MTPSGAGGPSRAWALWERRASEPMLPLRLFREVRFSAANARAFLTTASVFGAAFLITQYLQLALGSSPLEAGLRFLPMTATPLLVAPLAGAVSDRIGQRPVLVTGMLLQGIGLAAFAAAAAPGVGYDRLVIPLLVAGIGASMPLATATTAALGAVAPAHLGKASGVTRTVQNFGGVFGLALATAVFAANGTLGSAAGYDAGFHPALMAAAALALVGALTALGVGSRVQPATATHPDQPAGTQTERRITTWATR